MDNLKVKVGRFVMPVRPGTDADGVERRFVGHPVSGKLVYREFSAAVNLAGQVLDANPHVVAQVRPLRAGGTGTFAPLYAVSVARRS